MSFRVTQQTLSRTTMAGLQDNLARLQRTQEQLSSGRRVSRPSDSPVDTVAAMQLRADKQRTEQYARNIDDGLARLATADDALTEAVDVLGRVRQLVVAGLNDTNGPSERRAMADEMDQLRAGTIALANTGYLSQPLFAGTAATAVAFDPVTGRYAGNASAVNRTVSAEPGSGQIAVNVPGDTVFGTLLGDPAALPTTAPSGVLADLSTALRSGDRTLLQTALGRLDADTEGIRSAHSLIGARYNRLTGMQQQGRAHLDAVTGSLANAESIDLPKAIMDLQLQQTAYQAALGATAKIIQPSLVDFLR
jgi:flagellar hook-associated protein 3 FlgL